MIAAMAEIKFILLLTENNFFINTSDVKSVGKVLAQLLLYLTTLPFLRFMISVWASEFAAHNCLLQTSEHFAAIRIEISF